MKVHIVDKEYLSSLSPEQISSYLHNHGATKIDNFFGKGSIWKYKKESILVPAQQTYADYASRVYDILSSLEHAENRSHLLIAADIRRS